MKVHMRAAKKNSGKKIRAEMRDDWRAELGMPPATNPKEDILSAISGAVYDALEEAGASGDDAESVIIDIAVEEFADAAAKGRDDYLRKLDFMGGEPKPNAYDMQLEIKKILVEEFEDISTHIDVAVDALRESLYSYDPPEENLYELEEATRAALADPEIQRLIGRIVGNGS